MTATRTPRNDATHRSVPAAHISALPPKATRQAAPRHDTDGRHVVRAVRLATICLGMSLVAACGGLLPKALPPPSFYALEGRPTPAATPSTADMPATPPAPTLVVNPPHAAAGFDSTRIIYQREPHSHTAFAQSEWVDTPARMLRPLIVAAVQAGGGYRAVLSAPSPVVGDLRLDTEVLRLQQEFGAAPSRVHFTLRATLVDPLSRQVVAMRVFDQNMPSRTEDAYGGVVAANSVVQAVLDQLAVFCGEAAVRWQAGADARALVLHNAPRASDSATSARWR